MAEVAVGSADGVLAEVRDLAQTLIAPGAAEIDRESQLSDTQLSELRTRSAKAIAGLPVR